MTEEGEQGPTGANFAKRSARLGELELAGWAGSARGAAATSQTTRFAEGSDHKIP